MLSGYLVSLLRCWWVRCRQRASRDKVNLVDCNTTDCINCQGGKCSQCLREA
jgi:hypothetical protein